MRKAGRKLRNTFPASRKKNGKIKAWRGRALFPRSVYETRLARPPPGSLPGLLGRAALLPRLRASGSARPPPQGLRAGQRCLPEQRQGHSVAPTPPHLSRRPGRRGAPAGEGASTATWLLPHKLADTHAHTHHARQTAAPRAAAAVSVAARAAPPQGRATAPTRSGRRASGPSFQLGGGIAAGAGGWCPELGVRCRQR